MLSLISFIVVMIGAVNWFCIGLLQFDFVAGLFGSQSSIFSRIVYIAVGLGALVLLFNMLENKGKIAFKFGKNKNKGNQKQTIYYGEPKYSNGIEAGKDNYVSENQNHENVNTHEETIENNNNNCQNGSCQIQNDEINNNENKEK